MDGSASNPVVSVVIPTYNYARYLPQAIDSVLRQTFTNLEILVIDDGSTDQTCEVMQSFGPPVRYIRQDNAGVSAARNRGIAESVGKYVAFLDADDTWLPSKLERQLLALAAAPQCQVCYSAFVVTDRDLNVLRTARTAIRANVESLLFSGNVVGSLCTVIVERRLFDRVGRFDSALSQCADWDMWLRLAAHAEFLYIDEPVVTYRHHEVSMSTRIPLLEKDSLQVLRNGFDMAGVPEAMRRRSSRAFARNYMVLAGSYYHARQYTSCFRCVARALALDPRQILYLAAFPARMLKRRGRLVERT